MKLAKTLLFKLVKKIVLFTEGVICFYRLFSTRLYLQVQKNLMRLIFSDKFSFVYIAFVHLV